MADPNSMTWPFWEFGGSLGYARSFSSDVRFPATIATGQVRTRWRSRGGLSSELFGLHATRWETPLWAWRLDYEHQKLRSMIAAAGSRPAIYVDIDGLHQLAISRVRQFPEATFAHLTPYAGLGAGVDILSGGYHLDGQAEQGIDGVGGYFATGFMGLRYQIMPKWHSFVEAKFAHHLINRKDNDGRFKTRIGVSQVNVGVAYRF